jgi:hypothetical protein
MLCMHADIDIFAFIRDTADIISNMPRLQSDSSFIHSSIQFWNFLCRDWGSSTRAKLLQSIVKRRRDFKNDVFFVRLFKVESLVILLRECSLRKCL